MSLLGLVLLWFVNNNTIHLANKEHMQENVFNVFKAVSVLSFGKFCFERTHASKPILYCRVLENSKVCPCFILVINKEHIQCYHTYNIMKQNSTLHNITLHCITLHTLHYITLRYITLHYITVQYITLHHITLN